MSIVQPRVTLIASTALEFELTDTGVDDDGTVFAEMTHAVEEWMEMDENASDAETLMEMAGRGCYLSWHKPNPATRKNADYLKNTLFNMGHGSVAEHATATVYITGVSRALTHELVRHRPGMAYSQLSQRFVNEDEANIVVPPAIRKLDESSEGGTFYPKALEDIAATTNEEYTRLVDGLMGSGLPRKQAREAARAVLPNMAETRIMVTGNLRSWATILVRRSAPDADAEFREVAGLTLDALEPVAPAYFGLVREQIEAGNES